MLTAVFCHQMIISDFNKSEVSLITFLKMCIYTDFLLASHVQCF